MVVLNGAGTIPLSVRGTERGMGVAKALGFGHTCPGSGSTSAQDLECLPGPHTTLHASTSLPRPLPGPPFPAQVGFFCHPNSFSLQGQSSPLRWPWGSSGDCEPQGDHVTPARPTRLPCCRLTGSLLVSGGRGEVSARVDSVALCRRAKLIQKVLRGGLERELRASGPSLPVPTAAMVCHGASALHLGPRGFKLNVCLLHLRT